MEFEPVFMKPEKDTPQGLGSVLTYLRRYALSAVFGITSDQDDDANESSGNNSKSITSKQVGKIKTMAMTFAEARGKKPAEVYKALDITEKGIEKLTTDQASAVIKRLDGWMEKAEQSQAG